MNFRTSFLIASIFFAFNSCAQDKKSVQSNSDYSLVVPDLNNPWGFVFLPDNTILINEKEGKMILFKNGTKTNIENVPEVYNRGQGGLLDLALHPNYKENGWLYFTYASSEGEGNGGNTALMRAKLDGHKLVHKELLYKATPNTTKGQHFGSRIVFDADNYLFFTIGERGERDLNPQNITRDGGKVYRLNDDGSIPHDNPFFDRSNSKKAIYTYGHRNPQGMAVHPTTGAIWIHEHGPRGGDEINLIKAGANYGWPVISYGVNYSGSKFTDKTSQKGMEQPLHFWDPSIAPSGMVFISSDKYPGWKGNLLVGSLKFEYLDRCVVKDTKVIKEERLLEGLGRVRTIHQGPDGYIYVGIESLGIVKLLPKKS